MPPQKKTLAPTKRCERKSPKHRNLVCNAANSQGRVSTSFGIRFRAFDYYLAGSVPTLKNRRKRHVQRLVGINARDCRGKMRAILALQAPVAHNESAKSEHAFVAATDPSIACSQGRTAYCSEVDWDSPNQRCRARPMDSDSMGLAR